MIKKIILLTSIFFIISGNNIFAMSDVSADKSLLAPKKIEICPTDAKMCPDGTYVGRSGPNCEFAKCEENKKKEDAEKNIDKEVEEIKFCTREYLPVCGLVETGERCLSPDCPEKVKRTFGNKCMAEIAGAEIISGGVCDFSKNNGEDILKIDSKEIKEKIKAGLDAEKKELKEDISDKDEYLGNSRKLIIAKIAQAKDEEERKRLFRENIELIKKEKNIPLENSLESRNDIKKEEEEALFEEEKKDRRKENIQKKSVEIFSKFDFFVNKINSILLKLEKKVVLKDDLELSILYKETKDLFALAQEKKGLAWVDFNLLADVQSKEEAVKKLKKVGNNLKGSKELLKEVFEKIKIIVEKMK